MLPSYEELADTLKGLGWVARPILYQKPTRKGLGRYAATSILHSKEVREAGWPYWHQLWFSATTATRILLDYEDVRLPADTFDQWRVLVRQYVLRDRKVYMDDETAQQAYAWASR